jgi:hypothetical protein
MQKRTPVSRRRICKVPEMVARVVKSGVGNRTLLLPRAGYDEAKGKPQPNGKERLGSR